MLGDKQTIAHLYMPERLRKQMKPKEDKKPAKAPAKRAPKKTEEDK